MNLTEKSPVTIVWEHWIAGHRYQRIQLLKPLRNLIENLPIKDIDFAHRICRVIPSQCPFARTIKFFGKPLFTIPPLCKINPFYDELMMLRFRAMNYLVEAGEEIGAYC